MKRLSGPSLLAFLLAVIFIVFATVTHGDTRVMWIGLAVFNNVTAWGILGVSK